MKKLLKGPVLWIAAAVLAIFIGTSLGTSVTYKQVDTSYGIQLLHDGKAKSVKVYDGEQRVDIVLIGTDEKTKSKTVQFFYINARGSQVAQAIQDASIVDGFNDEVPNTPWYLSLLGSIFPILLIGGIFYFLMSGAAGGNSRAMNFGKSRAKQFNKENTKVTFKDVAGADGGDVQLCADDLSLRTFACARRPQKDDIHETFPCSFRCRTP